MFSGITRLFDSFQADPGGTIITLLYVAVCILFSLIIHECAHGYVALKCGDPTAKWMGRLTLDPRKHLDPLGTICMVFLRIGWAKPVPVNPRNFKNYRRDYILVSLAGITVNLLLCLLSLVISALLCRMMWMENMLNTARTSGQGAYLIDVYKGYFPAAIYNGAFSQVSYFARTPWLMYVQRFFLMLAQMNLGLAIFNLLPVPPLDGFRFLDQFAFKGNLRMTPQTMQIIQIIFLVVCFSGLLGGLLTTVNSFVMGGLCSLIGMLV